MTLLAMDGFETGDFAGRGYNSGSGFSRNATTRFGYGYSLDCDALWTRPIPVASNKVTVGIACFISTMPGTSGAPISLLADGGAAIHGGFQVNANGSISVIRNTTVLATSAATGLVTPGAWAYYELTGTIHDTIGTLTARVNGVEAVTYTGDTRNAGTSTNIDAIRVVPIGTATACLFDDLYILNDQGAAPWNAPLGDCRVQTLIPNGAGTDTGLTPNGSPNNWENVDDTPPSMTDYNSSGVAGAKDTYAMSNLVVGTDVIYGVGVNSYALKNDSGTRQIKNKLQTGGVGHVFASKALGVSAATYSDVNQVSPVTSAAWTAAEVNAVLAGAEVV